MRSFGVGLLAVNLAFAMTISTQADTVFTDRASFDSAVADPVQFESFENETVDWQPGARTVSFDYFDVTYDGTGSFGVRDTVLGGVGPTDGLNYLSAGYTAGISVNVVFAFQTPIYALGLDIRDVESPTLPFETSTGFSGTAATAGPDGNVQFFGLVTDTPFSSVTFWQDTAIGEGDGVGFDAVTVVPVPEPSTLALLGMGVVALLSFARRRRD